MQLTNKKSEAFTLLEMVIVIFIISILICLMLPNLGRQQKRAENIGREALCSVVVTQSDLYQQEKGSKPGSLEKLESEGYLTKAQLEQAKKENITVDGKTAPKGQ